MGVIGMSWLIKVKSPYFSEARAGVQFYNGEAKTDDPEKAKILAELGYEVIELKEKAEEKPKKASAKKSGE
jgi:hypothetical protein